MVQLVLLPYSRGRTALVIVINYMIFLLSFLDVTWTSISAVFFLAQLDPGILSL